MAVRNDVGSTAEVLAGFLSGGEQSDQAFRKRLQIIKHNGHLVDVINHPIRRYFGRTLVHIAAVNGLPVHLDILLQNGGDPNKPSSPTDQHQTPLHLAALRGYSMCIEVLLKHGSQIRIENANRVTPVELARGKIKCEIMFRRAIAKVEIPNRSQKQLQRVKDLHELLDEEGDLERFKTLFLELLEYEKDLGTRWTDWFQHTLLYRATDAQRVDIVSFLLQHSKSVPLCNLGNGKTPLIAACNHGNIKLANMILEHSPSLVYVCDEQNFLYPLHISCSRGEKGMVQVMLRSITQLFDDGEEEVRDINLRDRLGRTPLYNACYHGRLEVVKCLLEFKRHYSDRIDINAAEHTGRTPLHAAVSAERNSKEIVDLLLQHNEFNVNAEAKPSSRAQKYLLKVVQRKHSISRLGKSTAYPLEDTEEAHPPSPTFSDISTTIGSVSDDLDTEIGILNRKSTKPSSPTGPTSPIRMEAFTSTLPALPSHPSRRPTSPTHIFAKSTFVTQPVDPVGIYCSKQGCLEILEEQREGYISFSEVLVTPLAEACIFCNEDIVRMLLTHGALDKNGLSCQISFLVHRSTILQMILSHSCQSKEGELNEDQVIDTPSKTTHHLKWNKKYLYSIKGSWMMPNSTFLSSPMLEDHSLLCQPITFTKINSSNVSSVELQDNHLSKLPIELFNMPNVNLINVSKNNLTSLPESSDPGSGWGCYELEALNLSNNALVCLPTCLWLLPSLKKLSVKENKLQSIVTITDPSKSELLLCPSLTNIDLSYNKIVGLNEFFFSLPNIEKINLAHNCLLRLPNTLWKCESLQELDVSYNELQHLPYCEFHELFNREFKLEMQPDLFTFATPINDTNITLKDDMTKQTSISTGKKGRTLKTRKTDTNDFKIRQVADNIKDSHEVFAFVETSCDYSNLTNLNLSHNKLTIFPSGLPCFAPNLSELDISHNQIQIVDIVFLPQAIRKFNAKNCMIERFGNTLMDSQLRAVQRKCYHEDDLNICLHRSHSCLLYLQTLNLYGNKLKRFQLLRHPPLKRKTQDATEAELEFRQDFTSLSLLYPSLDGLDLSHNELEGQFNPNIGRMTQLKWIRLNSNTNLERLPLEFALLKGSRCSLTELQINNLPNLIQPPSEYQDPQVQVNQLLTYMRSRLKHSVPYRTMKLFFIGRGHRGKTTLLRRLKEHDSGEARRTEGIDIEEWDCRGKVSGGSLFRTKKPPIHFLAWDFAGQDDYQVTHQCFYSRRALYIAVFRLSDGLEGVNELDHWLRNVQLRAPGSIVIVVGTHLDKVSESESLFLEEEVRKRYRRGGVYPQVVGCFSVSCVNKVFKSNIDNLRQFIYQVATHLKVTYKDGDKLEYKPDLDESSHHALLQQQIPLSFLDLQRGVRDLSEGSPVLYEEEFYQQFRKLFDDDDELNEAVHYLTLQGTLLHFEDHGLKILYFLDPQWLAKLMARIISPSVAGYSNMIEGKIAILDLFKEDPLFRKDEQKAESYLHLLQKFEVALQINDYEVIIPSMLPDEPVYPKPDDSLKDVSLSLAYDDFYQPPIRRFWFSNYIPEGFWPRLICRIMKDYQIKSVLSQYSSQINDHTPLEWTIWRGGMVFASRGRTIVVLRIVQNSTEAFSINGNTIKPVEAAHRIEAHVYIPEMIRVMQEMLFVSHPGEDNVEEEVLIPFNATGHATRIMVAVSNHIISLSSWFNGMVMNQSSMMNGYLPCWKCFAGIEGKAPVNSGRPFTGEFVIINDLPSYCLSFNECIVPACTERDLSCVAHGALKVVHMAPDLVFWDLITDHKDLENTNTLEINETELLGKGGFGFVCKGVLRGTSGVEQVEPVAVKVFLCDLENKIDVCSTSKLISLSREHKQLLHAYTEIRKEVSFLAGLNHVNITKLRGVKNTPTLCLMLELAPKKALRGILKEYREQKLMLEPLSLKQCANQIADGLQYLHSHQIVHLDMKSPNVLVWDFPLAHILQEERVEQAGNVWIKIADYGISQVSTSMLMRVGGSPVGTPGYMAPEMFENIGQELFADKLDVFGYGMVLYELISLQVPFHKQPPQKRNHDVSDRKRPPIGNQEKHTPLFFQDLMRLCWQQDPSSRPSMKQCLQWTSITEFERLRTEITLGNCSSISCACVSRIEPQHEKEWAQPQSVDAHNPYDSFTDVPRIEMDGSLFTKEEVKHFGIDFEILAPQEDVTIEEKDQEEIHCSVEEEEENIDGLSHELVINEGDVVRKSTRRLKKKSALQTTTDLTRALLQRRETGQRSESQSVNTKRQHESYTQIWMCGRDSKKGLLALFICPDNQKNIYKFFGYVGSEEIQALCPIRNAIWMGTSKGSIRVVHAPTLFVKYSGKLLQDEKATSPILKILHVEEESCVIVSIHVGEIWCLHDRLGGQPTSLVKRQRILMNDRDDCGPVYDLVKVVVDGEVQVWGTMDNNLLILLTIKDGLWCKSYHQITPPNYRMKVCSYIVYCNFNIETEEGEILDEHHLWVSYRNKGGLVCIDARTKQQIATLNCTEILKVKDDDQTHQVSTLLAQGRKLFIGTLSGVVAVFDSQSRSLITRYNWHEGKVRTLLPLPKQIKPCICAEVSMNTKQLDNSIVHRQLGHFVSHTVDRSTRDNPCYLPNTMESTDLIASIGNGRRKMIVKEEGKTTKRFRSHTWVPERDEDITLLMWHS